MLHFLYTTGEHIKNWRKRYFVLVDDGRFYGYKTKPEHGLGDPLNNFTVKGKILFLCLTFGEIVSRIMFT